MKNKELLNVIDDKLAKPLDSINKEQQKEEEISKKRWANLWKKINDVEKLVNDKFKSISDNFSKQKTEIQKALENNEKTYISYYNDIEKRMINAFHISNDNLNKGNKNLEKEISHVRHSVLLLEDTFKRRNDSTQNRLGDIEYQLREIKRDISELHSFIRTLKN